jgi:hypothetical protein
MVGKKDKSPTEITGREVSPPVRYVYLKGFGFLGLKFTIASNV